MIKNKEAIRMGRLESGRELKGRGDVGYGMYVGEFE